MTESPSAGPSRSRPRGRLLPAVGGPPGPARPAVRALPASRPRSRPAPAHLLLPRPQHHLLSAARSSRPGSCARDAGRSGTPTSSRARSRCPISTCWTSSRSCRPIPSPFPSCSPSSSPSPPSAPTPSSRAGRGAGGRLRRGCGLRPRRALPLVRQPLRLPAGPGARPPRGPHPAPGRAPREADGFPLAALATRPRPHHPGRRVRGPGRALRGGALASSRPSGAVGAAASGPEPRPGRGSGRGVRAAASGPSPRNRARVRDSTKGVALGHATPPIALLQVVVPDLFGSALGSRAVVVGRAVLPEAPLLPEPLPGAARPGPGLRWTRASSRAASGSWWRRSALLGVWFALGEAGGLAPPMLRPWCGSCATPARPGCSPTWARRFSRDWERPRSAKAIAVGHGSVARPWRWPLSPVTCSSCSSAAPEFRATSSYRACDRVLRAGPTGHRLEHGRHGNLWPDGRRARHRRAPAGSWEPREPPFSWSR